MFSLDRALEISRRLQIDEFEIVHVKRKIITVRITDSEIFEVKHVVDENYGIRIIHKKKILSIKTSNEEEIKKSIETSFKTISHLNPRQFWKSLPHELPSQINLEGVFDKNLDEISGSEITDIAQVMIDSSLNPKINTISGSLNIVSENFKIVNSNGLSANDRGTYISGIINANSEMGRSEVSGIGHGCCRTLDRFFPKQIGEEAKIMCIESINPQKCERGEYSIIFEPYSVGELLAFVVSPNFNLKVFSEKKSCFSEKLKEKIAVDDLTLIDNPHIPQGIGTKPFDDEGEKTQINTLIENGIFVNTYSNLYDSFKEDVKSTGNASRPGSPMGRSAEPIPFAMPHNMQIVSGNVSQEDLIKDTKKGILVGRLWYTYAVNPIKGDFSCTARSGIRIIENGKIKSPGKSVRIIHNLPRLFQNISGVGKNKKNVLQWASSPSITPSIKVEKIKVTTI